MKESSEKKKGRPRPGAPSVDDDLQLPAIPTATAAASLATPSAATTTAATEATTRTSFLGTRFVDRQSPATEIAAVKRLDRLLSFVRGTHLDKSEAPRTTAELIGDHASRFDSSMGGKDFLQLVVGRRVWQSTDVDFTTHVLLLWKTLLSLTLRT
jgi:hypothetical protein